MAIAVAHEVGMPLRIAVPAPSRVETIDRARCRAVVADRFSVTAMTDGYERVCRELR